MIIPTQLRCEEYTQNFHCPLILNQYCEKNKVIPSNQAGFRKGRSTIDHLVQLTAQIKRQCARRKNIFEAFFVVKKACDQNYCGTRAFVYKLKYVGLTGIMYNYINSFLSNRTIQTKVGNTYSNPRTLRSWHSTRISFNTNTFLNMLIQELPKSLSKNVMKIVY